MGNFFFSCMIFVVYLGGHGRCSSVFCSFFFSKSVLGERESEKEISSSQTEEPQKKANGGWWASIVAHIVQDINRLRVTLSSSGEVHPPVRAFTDWVVTTGPILSLTFYNAAITTRTK